PSGGVGTETNWRMGRWLVTWPLGEVHHSPGTPPRRLLREVINRARLGGPSWPHPPPDLAEPTARRRRRRVIAPDRDQQASVIDAHGEALRDKSPRPQERQVRADRREPGRL